MSKQLVIKNVIQVHTETDSKGNIVLWVETSHSLDPLRDVKEQNKEE